MNYKKYELRFYPDPVLRNECSDVKADTEYTYTLVREMEEVLREFKEKGLGLAAPQVGENVNLFILNLSGYTKKLEDYKTFINPTVLESDFSEMGIEGCLSLPGVAVAVHRDTYVKLEAEDTDGDRFEYEASGLLARAILHELDHLKGKLVIDYAEGIQQTIIEPALSKLKSRYRRSKNKKGVK